MAKAVARSVWRLKAVGLATRTRFASRTLSAQSRARSINAILRRWSDDCLDEVRRINRSLAGIAERAVRQARAVTRNARQGLRRRGRSTGRARAEVTRLEQLTERTERIAEQCRQRTAGTTRGRPGWCRCGIPTPATIVKGRLGRPVEFSYKAQIVDNEAGIVIDHNIEAGNPPDGPMLASAVERIKQRTGRAPRAAPLIEATAKPASTTTSELSVSATSSFPAKG